ncbi:ArsC family reductase [Pedobacter sp. HMF7647]|uniref:ArsC family reductase n=1 Tax=Hufsiella arboris TaxID=2695275 RepID=A0A7K1Y8M6_9SPHI|nr:ArsC family reductase [Hufsiella arboris]MXV50935.1 ArsC family reductase [Hufsiella arboris]
MIVYGIKNCNTVKKALDWLSANNIQYEFHDFKKSGAPEEKLKEWIDKVGWEPLVNKRGTTWKQLDPAVQQTVNNEQAAIKLMQEKTSVIKRPVIERDGNIILGFDEEQYKSVLTK